MSICDILANRCLWQGTEDSVLLKYLCTALGFDSDLKATNCCFDLKTHQSVWCFFFKVSSVLLKNIRNAQSPLALFCRSEL